MCSDYRKTERLQAALLALALLVNPALAADDAGALRVCADPNNLPFSNEQEQGFENELAELIAAALGRDGVTYEWHPQRRGFVRNTLDAGKCDVIMGVPAHYELAATTTPYYRSSYVFVYRKDAGYDITSLDDPELATLKVGVHAVGDDYSSTPGAAAMARRGYVDNLVGFSIYGDYSEPHPPSRLIEAVADGRVDVAIAWGPLAGYFAARSPVPLEIVPVSPSVDEGLIPFVFEISMATRRDDEDLRASLERVIASKDAEVRALLERYGVPLVPARALPATAEARP